MAKTEYLTAPLKTDRMPPGVPYIVGNEAAERFSYYGMRSILVIFMTQYLMDRTGAKAVMSREQAMGYYHLFVFGVYFIPLFGAILADAFWGKFRTIMCLSIVYCIGNFALALDQTRFGLALGLVLIAVGSGGIKPCVSANVGDQFGPSNQHLLPKVFGWFYLSINVGSTLSMLLIPWLNQRYGPQIAFGVPGVLMLVATVIFWMGRKRFAHIPPGGMDFVRETFGLTGLKTVAKLIPVYLPVAMFWSLYDQSGSAWVLQAEKMNRHFLGMNWLSSQVQVFNPVLVLIFVPFFSYILYPALSKIFPLTPLRKVSIGFFVAVASFLVPAYVEKEIGLGHAPGIVWQLIAYMLLTAAEVMISVTCLEFAYTQAPKKMKSLVMALYLVSIAAGNLFTSGVNFFIKNPDQSSKLSGPQYYLFFSALLFATGIVFIFVALKYKEQTYIQEEAVPA
jgi:POT family proton-dependent oligopeptide transporter